MLVTKLLVTKNPPITFVNRFIEWLLIYYRLDYLLIDWDVDLFVDNLLIDLFMIYFSRKYFGVQFWAWEDVFEDPQEAI